MEKWVKDLSSVPEHLRQFYEAKKNAAGEDGFEIQDISALKSALANAKSERAALKGKADKVTAFEELGVDIDDLKALIAAKKTKDEDDAKAAGNWDKLKQQLVDQHNVAMATKDKELASMRSALEVHLIDADATRYIAEEKGEPDLLLHHVRSHVKVIQKDGKFMTQVVGADGAPRIDGQGQPISIKALVGEMKKEPRFKRAFDGINHSGSGAPPNGGGGGAPPAGSKVRSAMAIQEKTAYIAEHGQAAFLALPWK